jgi:hypothetical protein
MRPGRVGGKNIKTGEPKEFVSKICFVSRHDFTGSEKNSIRREAGVSTPA